MAASFPNGIPPYYLLAQYVRINEQGHIEILFLDPNDNMEHLLNADLTNIEWTLNDNESN